MLRGGLKKAAVFILTIAFMMVSVSCSKQENLDSKVSEITGEIIGDYQYPENPAEQLRSALESDVNSRGLSMKIGIVEKVELDSREYFQIKIDFTDGDENVCIITFFNKHVEYGYDESLDGRDNPSLVQARYTNPHTFFSTEEFESKMGVTVTALKQIWGEPGTQNARELKTIQDFSALSYILVKGDEEQEKTVYADFIIQNVWNHLECLHGDTWVTVDALSMAGVQYTLRLENMRMLMNYEFGVGQKYTLFIYTGASNGPLIYYAVQQSESEDFNSRGEHQPLDYPAEDWENRITRTEPKDGDKVYNVLFQLQSCSYGPFVVIEGYGALEQQWPLDPQRDGYEFAGWYDNEDFTGTPYTKEMPIYQDTILYAKWKYSGHGGVWPRSHHGIINGVSEGEIFYTNQTILINAEGYNMHIKVPDDQRFRWVPVGWKVENLMIGEFPDKAPYSAAFSIDAQGGYKLYITYKEEIFDGIAWQETGQMREVEEVDFQIKGTLSVLS